MTFDQWAESNWMYVDVKDNAREIWEAARKAEREQCANLCRELGQNKTSGAYRQCAVAIESLKD